MKLYGDGNEVSDLLIYLSREEAAELRDALVALLDNFDVPGWHAHASTSDYQTEITVAPQVEEGEPKDNDEGASG